VPKKPSLSPSRITTYLACPVKYRWTYVDRRGRWYVRAKAQYSFGQTLHRVLEHFYAEDRTGVMTMEEVATTYEENWVDAGFSSQDEMMDAYGEGLAILRQHVQTEKVRPRIGRTFLLEKTLRLDLGDFDLIGRLDRVDEMPDGSLEVIDYKSGRETVSEDEVAGHLPMAIYQLLLRRTYPERLARATIVALKTQARASFCHSDADLAALEADLRVLGAEILRDDYFDLEPRPKRLCHSCDFLPLCRQHPDFAGAYQPPEVATG
jgi:RecB family exonuclease